MESPLYPSNRILKFYYAATAAFLILDLVFHINVRVAFLEPWPMWRLAYYAVCFGVFVMIALRPGLAEVLGVVESLVTLVALILSMGVRVMLVPADLAEFGASVVSGQEIINFVISGGIAWLSWHRGMLALAGKLPD